ncbi:hypothetical protein V6N11_044637 [Hibiscus sabdariffa]|uniref:Reverse transcriptase zinc-binding domain-containing protein n=1 Tax=Hibiscus sabdariffa TaxID=183260 RepID=A0ABR2NC14_9ROSI
MKNLKNNVGVLVSDEPTLSVVSHNILDTPFTSEEILAALKEMSPLKASGEYNVKSGYKMLMTSIQHDSQVSQHVAPSAKSFYDSLWNSVIPNKTKITVWRFAKNFLSTRSNLSTRHLVNDSSCPFCHLSPETVQHLGNRLVLENVLPALDSYVLFIRNYAAEYTTSQLVLNQPSHPSPPHWNPSSGNLIKVNFDVAFDTNSFSSSSGIVFRNNKGLLMAAAVFPHSHVLNSCAVEAQACLDVGCNATAHQAALLGRNCSSYMVWIEEAPTTIEEIVRKDRRWVDPPDQLQLSSICLHQHSCSVSFSF